MLSKLIVLALCCAGVGCRSASPRETAREPQPRPGAQRPAAAAQGTFAPAPAPAPALPERAPAPATSAPAASPQRGAPSAPHILVLGDSLSDPKVGGGGYLRPLLAHCPGARIDNLARGGFMLNQMRRRFATEGMPLLSQGVTHLVVFGGVNDLYSDESAGRSFEKISRDLEHLYSAARQRGIAVIAVTVAPWGGFSRYFTPRRAQATRRLNDWIAEQRASGLVNSVVDASALLACGDPERLCPEYEAASRDGLHFGKLGHERLGQALVEAFGPCR